MRWIRVVGVVLMLLAAVVGVAWMAHTPIVLALAQRMTDKRMLSNPAAELPDGLHVGLCGAGSQLLDDRRSEPCTLVQAGARLFVFDAGSGAARNITRMGFVPGKIEAIFLTHFHADHINGLGELMLQRWVSASQPMPVTVHGPQGVQEVVDGVMQSYAQDRRYRAADHGDATLPDGGFGAVAHAFEVDASGREVVLMDRDLEIVAFTVEHGGARPAVGYRIRYKDRTVVISGDTRRSAAVQREAQGVDLLVHDAVSTPLMEQLQDSAARAGRVKLQKMLGDATQSHSSPEDAAEVAHAAKAQRLLLTHIMPPLPLPAMEQAFLGRAKSIYSGPLQVGVDGDFISLPVGSRQAVAGRRM